MEKIESSIYKFVEVDEESLLLYYLQTLYFLYYLFIL